MKKLLVTLGSIISFLGSAKSSSAPNDHFTLVNTQVPFLESRIEELEHNRNRLADRKAALNQQITSQQTNTDFVEIKGALFERLPNGTFNKMPYCPICKRIMWCFHEAFPYECSNKSCGGHTTSFPGRELNNVIANL